MLFATTKNINKTSFFVARGGVFYFKYIAMKNLFYFIAGVLFITLISATAASVITIKPQQPKETIVKPFWGMYGIQEEMSKYTVYQIKKGFIVKAITLDSEENGYQRGIVVLEKY